MITGGKDIENLCKYGRNSQYWAKVDDFGTFSPSIGDFSKKEVSLQQKPGRYAKLNYWPQNRSVSVDSSLNVSPCNAICPLLLRCSFVTSSIHLVSRTEPKRNPNGPVTKE